MMRTTILALTFVAGVGLGTEASSGCVFTDKCIKIVNPGTNACKLFSEARSADADGNLTLPIVDEGLVAPLGCICVDDDERDVLEEADPNDPLFQELDAMINTATRLRCLELVDEQDLGANNCNTSAIAGQILFVGHGDCFGSCVYTANKGVDCPDDCPQEFPHPAESGTGDGDGDGDSTTGNGGEPETPLDDIEAHVECIGPDTCEVTDTLVDFVLENPEALVFSDTTRLREKQKGGQVIGWHFTGVSPGSLADALTFANGDVVTAIDGAPVADADAAFAAIGDAIFNEVSTVTVVRDGKTRELVIAVVPG